MKLLLALFQTKGGDVKLMKEQARNSYCFTMVLLIMCLLFGALKTAALSLAILPRNSGPYLRRFTMTGLILFVLVAVACSPFHARDYGDYLLDYGAISSARS